MLFYEFTVYQTDIRGQRESGQANILTLVSHLSPQSEMLIVKKSSWTTWDVAARLYMRMAATSPGLAKVGCTEIFAQTHSCWSFLKFLSESRSELVQQDHGGTGPGEHQPSGPLRVSRRPPSARLVRRGVHHAEVGAGSRAAQLPLGLSEGGGSDHSHHCGDGECTNAHLQIQPAPLTIRKETQVFVDDGSMRISWCYSA